MISQIGQAFIRDSQVVIMPFLTFMMFTAGTMHLNNTIVSADGATARRFLKRTLDVMSRLGAHWQVSYKCYTMLNTLVRTNQIVFDPVVDSSDAEIQAIKARCHMIAQVAREAHESWLQGRAQHPHPRSRRSSTSTAGPTPAPPENTTRPPVPIAARTDSMPVNAASGPDSFRDQGRPLSYIPGLRRSSTSALSALPVAARPDGRAQDRSLWMRRNPDDRGSLAVPATAYSSALRPDPPGRSSSMGMAGGLPLSLPAAAGSAAGQFVPTLEFFANADYPLGIGGPNGVAPTAQPLGQGAGDGLEQLAGLLGDLEAKPYSMGLGLHMLATPDTPALQLSNGAAANPVLQPGGEPGLYMWSQLRAGSSAASAPATAAAMALGSLAQPRAGFGGSFTSDDMLRDLLCSGPVSFDLSELANRAGLLAGAHPAGPTSDTQSAEYASQLFRMLNGGGSSTDTSQP
ncbi:hypothetical protein H4R19_004049 [Coemansia spiralis]|nr:hypothetical protein H4R19_004049 [Coemansia spiralis]